MRLINILNKCVLIVYLAQLAPFQMDYVLSLAYLIGDDDGEEKAQLLLHASSLSFAWKLLSLCLGRIHWHVVHFIRVSHLKETFLLSNKSEVCSAAAAKNSSSTG